MANLGWPSIPATIPGEICSGLLRHLAAPRRIKSTGPKHIELANPDVSMFLPAFDHLVCGVLQEDISWMQRHYRNL
ncbi:hypothetical protein PgNI_10404 [Pyricularia grisea]|uniref:Uncharacterized protein n=1 Tax=Pyricularia grisea TaxID=148305 RepID=A0A6P8AY59_PYRGI|nr:hypothetical protein PgNI_10404 [Pyricularia grisea]TLD07221.1 hypothetical protein PgNI_10404 [Pyricularia grisea]